MVIWSNWPPLTVLGLEFFFQVPPPVKLSDTVKVAVHLTANNCLCANFSEQNQDEARAHTSVGFTLPSRGLGVAEQSPRVVPGYQT